MNIPQKSISLLILVCNRYYDFQLIYRIYVHTELMNATKQFHQTKQLSCCNE